MKKIIITIVIGGISIIAVSQQKTQFEKIAENRIEKKGCHALNISTNETVPLKSRATTKFTSEYQDIIGETVYDLQTVGIMDNKTVLFDDGTIGAVWTMGMEPPDFTDLGTGYNYFDGTSWNMIPYNSVETVRASNPAYAAWGDNGEVIVSNSPGQGTLVLNFRPEKGTGNWQEILFQSPVNCPVGWPKITTSGIANSSIHLLYLTGDCQAPNQGGMLFYTRSTDGGQTWSDNSVLEGTGSNYYTAIYPDSYTWAEPANGVIAFLCTSSWYDLFFMKSTDNGETWQKTVVWEHPYPFFDWDSTLFDEFVWAPDNSGDIAIDNNGTVHIVFGLTRVKHPEPGNSFDFLPFTDGIVYWNENMPPFTAENQSEALSYDNLVQDSTLIGWSGFDPPPDSVVSYRELGMSTMPEISIRQSDNQIFVSWSAPTIGYGNGEDILRHIILRSSQDGGNNWSDFYDINTNIVNWLDECIYPVMAGNTGDELYIMYQADNFPGTAVDGDHDWTDNNIYFWHGNTDEIFTGTAQNTSIPNITVSQNYPNPFSKTSDVVVNLKEKAGLSISITDITGQVVKTIDKGEVNAGIYNFTIDATELKPGIYFYTVNSGEYTVTRKMIVK